MQSSGQKMQQYQNQRVTFSPTKSAILSLKEVTYTPEKLYENYIFKEVNSNKRLQDERQKARIYEGENLIQNEKIHQLQTEIRTIRQTFNEQIDMYKKLIKDLEAEKKKHIERLQEEFRLQIRTILDSHEEVAKVEQARREELELKIEQLQSEIDLLNNGVKGAQNTIGNLNAKVDSLKTQLTHTQSLLTQNEQARKVASEQAKAEYESLKKTSANQRSVLINRYETQLADKEREIQGLIDTHKQVSDKQELQRLSDLANKDSEIRSLTADYEAERKGFEELLDAKEASIARLVNELTKEKEKNVRNTGFFEGELKKNIEQNELLKLELRKYTDMTGTLKLMKGDAQNDNRLLSEQVKKLREVLMESSVEMDRIRAEFVRLDSENDRLRRGNFDNDKETHRMKLMLAEKEDEARNWMENYFALKARF